MSLSGARPIVCALADTLLPEGHGAPSGGSIVPDALEDLAASMSASERGELQMALWLVELGSLPRHGRRFSKLAEARRSAYLDAWMRSRVGTQRSVFRALRGLCLNLYYADPKTWDLIGYAGPPLGRERRS